MQVIILADRHGAELAPLQGHECLAMLELAGRKVLDYTLEELAEAGIREAVIVSHETAAIERHAGDGSRWGLQLRYFVSPAQRSPAEILERMGTTGPALLVRGDVIRGRVIHRFLERTKNLDGNCLAATSSSRDIGLCFVRKHWTHGAAWPATELGIFSVDLDAGGFYALECLENFHAASLAVIRGQIAGVTPGGRRRPAGYHAGPQAQVDPRARSEDELLVGTRASLGARVRCVGGVVIGDGAIVDSHATLRNAVVMPGTYVGRGLEVSNAIVDGDVLVRVDLGTITHVTDRFLIARAASRIQTPWLSRIGGALLSMLSLPLWPIAMVAALINRPERPVVRLQMVGNRGIFPCWQFSARSPVLRCLPMLLHVAKGHLQLVGSTPMVASRAKGRNGHAPAGLISPAFVDTPPGATAAERVTSELAFAATRTPLRAFGYFLRSAVALGFGRGRPQPG